MVCSDAQKKAIAEMTDALEVFSAFLFKYFKEGSKEELSPDLLKLFSQQLALTLDAKPGSSGPPRRAIKLEEAPDAFDPILYARDQQRIYYRAESGNACINIHTGRAEPLPLEAEQMLSRDFSCSPDGQLYTDRNDYVGIFESATGRELNRLSWERHDTAACTVNVVFSPDGQLIAVSYAYDHYIRIWNIKTNHYLGEYAAPNHEAALAFNPDGNFLFAGTKSGVCLFDVDSRLRIFHHRTRGSYNVGYAPSGRSVIASAGHDELNLFDLKALFQPLPTSLDNILNVVVEHEEKLFNVNNPKWENLVWLIKAHWV